MFIKSILILILATSLETMRIDKIGKSKVVSKLKAIQEFDNDDLFFVLSKESQAKKEKKENRFDHFVSNDTVRIDGILHFDITKNPSKWKKAYAIENDFKDILSMKYMKYIYERDGYWRTWREIKYPDGKKKIISYKSQSIVSINGSECDNRGTWVIEEGTPPCPFELLSVINSAELCAVNYMKLKEQYGSCPSIIKFWDLTATCNNPIVTRWRISRDYAVSGRFKNIVCGGRDFCDIVTLYQINPQHVTFKIINGSSIFYSRVMLSDKKNYACVNRCGDINIKTFEVTPSRFSDKSDKIPKENKDKKEGKKNGAKTDKNGAKKQKPKKSEVAKRVVTLNAKGKIKKVITIDTKNKNSKKLKNLRPGRLRVDNFYNTRIKITEAPIITTTKAHYKKIVGKNPHKSEEEIYYDTYESEEQPGKKIN